MILVMDWESMQRSLMRASSIALLGFGFWGGILREICVLPLTAQRINNICTLLILKLSSVLSLFNKFFSRGPR